MQLSGRRMRRGGELTGWYSIIYDDGRIPRREHWLILRLLGMNALPEGVNITVS